MAVNREAAEFGKRGGESWWGAGVAWWGWPRGVQAPVSQRSPSTQQPQLPTEVGKPRLSILGRLRLC